MLTTVPFISACKSQAGGLQAAAGSAPAGWRFGFFSTMGLLFKNTLKESFSREKSGLSGAFPEARRVFPVRCKAALPHVAFFALFFLVVNKTERALGLTSSWVTSADLLPNVPGRARAHFSLQSPGLREGWEGVAEDRSCLENTSACFGRYPGEERAGGKRKYEEIFVRVRNNEREVA